MLGLMKRGLWAVTISLALAACRVVPAGEVVETAPPVVEAPEVPTETTLPTDTQRHRVALLVPLSGTNGAVGQAIANATTMALLDTNAENLRITTYDTAPGAGTAASRAIADGNRLILGPLTREDVGTVLAQARPANVPLITFSNDSSIARPDVFVMGLIPEQAITRAIDSAYATGARRFAVLVPEGDYGDRALAAVVRATGAGGGTLVGQERFDRSNRSVVSAVSRLEAGPAYDALIVADGARFAVLAVEALRANGTRLPQIIGTELWSGDAAANVAELRGARFASVSDARFGQFAQSYETRFGERPNRIATLGYDSVLLTLRIARDWQPGSAFPIGRLIEDGGFLGLDGPFRFRSNGLGERALEVREIGNGTVSITDAAPSRF